MPEILGTRLLRAKKERGSLTQSGLLFSMTIA